MTTQEALAQALRHTNGQLSGSYHDIAGRIIDALPEGWELVDVPHFGQYTLDQRAYGAQQERERLRRVPIIGDADGMPPYRLPDWVKTPTSRGEAPIDLLEHFRDWLLRDPDEETP